MDPSSLTGLDIIIIVSLAFTLVAVITVVFLLISINEKLSTKADTNRDATVRFAAWIKNDKICFTARRVLTQLGVVAFTNGLNDESITNVKADIVINSTSDTTSSGGVDYNGEFRIF